MKPSDVWGWNINLVSISGFVKHKFIFPLQFYNKPDEPIHQIIIIIIIYLLYLFSPQCQIDNFVAVIHKLNFTLGDFTLCCLGCYCCYLIYCLDDTNYIWKPRKQNVMGLYEVGPYSFIALHNIHGGVGSGKPEKIELRLRRTTSTQPGIHNIIFHK